MVIEGSCAAGTAGPFFGCPAAPLWTRANTARIATKMSRATLVRFAVPTHSLFLLVDITVGACDAAPGA